MIPPPLQAREVVYICKRCSGDLVWGGSCLETRGEEKVVNLCWVNGDPSSMKTMYTECHLEFLL